MPLRLFGGHGAEAEALELEKQRRLVPDHYVERQAGRADRVVAVLGKVEDGRQLPVERRIEFQAKRAATRTKFRRTKKSLHHVVACAVDQDLVFLSYLLDELLYDEGSPLQRSPNIIFPLSADQQFYSSVGPCEASGDAASLPAQFIPVPDQYHAP